MQNQMHRIDSQHLEFLASTTLLTTIEKIRRIQYLTGTLHSRKRAFFCLFVIGMDIATPTSAPTARAAKMAARI